MNLSVKLRKSELRYIDSYKISGKLSLREYNRKHSAVIA